MLIGYAPADDPQIAVAVVLEYGGGRGQRRAHPAGGAGRRVRDMKRFHFFRSPSLFLVHFVHICASKVYLIVIFFKRRCPFLTKASCSSSGNVLEYTGDSVAQLRKGADMNAQCIMVCSGKGGTGKSTVSVLLGACLARLGRKVLLIELDSGLRSVDIIAGVYGRTVYDIEDVLCGRCEGPRPLCPARFTPGCRSSAPPMKAARWMLRPWGGFWSPCAPISIL